MRIGSLLEKVGGATSFLSGKSVAPIQPPVLGGANRFPYGSFQFRTHLTKGTPYEIHASSDLRNWAMIANGTSNGEPLEYLDTDASKFNHRFYRMIAGDLPSINVLGYATTILPPGFSMIGNPFETSANTVAELLKDWPDGTTLSRFDLRMFRLSENKMKSGKWSNPAEQLLPAEGAIIFNPTMDYRPLSFFGEVTQGSNLSIPIPAGFSVRSSVIPQCGALADDLKFPIADGDVIHLFDHDRQRYAIFPFEDGKWKSGQPVVSIGESFWVAKTSAGNWTRDFTV